VRFSSAVAAARRGDQAITHEHLVLAGRSQSQPQVSGTWHEQFSEDAAESLASVLSEQPFPAADWVPESCRDGNLRAEHPERM